MDNQRSSVPTIIETVNASPGIPVFTIKGELEDIKSDFKPALHEYADIDYTSDQPNMRVVKQENAFDNDDDDPMLCTRVKEEIIGEEWRDMDWQLCLQATSTPAVAGSMNVETAGSRNIMSIILDHTYSVGQDTYAVDPHHRPNQKNTSADDGNVANLHNTLKEESVEDERRADKDAQRSIKPTQAEQRVRSQSYRCDSCVETFTCRKLLLQHSRNLHPRSHKCTKCNKKFLSTYHLHIHTSNAHSEQQHECAFCKKIYTWKSSLSRHVNMVHRPRPADKEPWQPCLQATSTPAVGGSKNIGSIILDHTYSVVQDTDAVDTHHRPNQQNASVVTEENMFGHDGNHLILCNRLTEGRVEDECRVSGPEIHICHNCQKTFKTKWTLSTHVTRVHASGSYKCSQCDKHFKCERYRTIHTTRIHTAGSHQLHTCTNCGMNFKLKWNCYQHERRGKCARPTASNTSAVASTSRQQPKEVIVKDEPADAELELGPTVFQHMDCNYRPYKPEPQLD